MKNYEVTFTHSVASSRACSQVVSNTFAHVDGNVFASISLQEVEIPQYLGRILLACGLAGPADDDDGGSESSKRAGNDALRSTAALRAVIA